MKVLLLENIHPTAHGLFQTEGYQVEALPKALNEEELISKLSDVHLLGIRSKTQVTEHVLKNAPKLLSVGAFCIGTNQIDLDTAKKCGIPVFNAPFGNTRSVAELVIAEMIALARQMGDRSREVHSGLWNKISQQCFEVRGKTVGIVGYGNIGSQVSTLAEALGMRVLFFDILSKLPLGNAKSAHHLSELLKESDFVTLHVPATPLTDGLIGFDQIQMMKPGAFLINASRGGVVDLNALAHAIRERRLGGAAIDVYPSEPEANGKGFQTPLQGLPNVLLTPHIAGATEEAQSNIGTEVPTTLLRFVNAGATLGAVNFPAVDLAPMKGTHRILNVHKNVPGVLRDITKIVSDLGANIQAQHLATDESIGYLVLDTDQSLTLEVKGLIDSMKASVRTRILY